MNAKLQRLGLGVIVMFLLGLVMLNARAGVSPTGSFETSIPLELPPGINGVRPNLSVNYDSNAGNGILGVGWSLSGLPVLARTVGKQAISYSTSDTYSDVDGPLLPTAEARGPDETPYRNSNENWNLYRAINSGCVGGPCSWRVTDRVGNTIVYGGTSSAQAKVLARGDAIRAWHISSYTDVFGNSYSVQYLQDQGAIYPQTIQYGQSKDGRGTVVTVSFVYEARPDEIVQMLQDARVHYSKRLHQIEIRVGNALFRRYVFEYASDGFVSRLIGVAESGVARDTESTRRYQVEWQSEQRDFHGEIVKVETNPKPPLFGNTSNAVVRDVTGDGRSDLLFIVEEQGYQSIADANGFFSPVKFAIGSKLDLKDLSFGDINGDGRDDILWITPTQSRIALGTDAGLGDLMPAVPAEVVDPLQDVARTYERFLADFNGDGLDDLLVIKRDATQHVMLLSDGKTFSGRMSIQIADPILLPADKFVPRMHERDRGPRIPIPQAQVFAIDMNADGRADIVRFGIDNKNRVWLASSDGALATNVPITDAGESLFPVAVATTAPTDIDGDGRIDFVKVGKDGSAIYRFDGNAFRKEPIPAAAKPSYTGTDDWVNVADFDGDGHPDILVLSKNAANVSNELFMWNGMTFERSSDAVLAKRQILSTKGATEVADFDGDGAQDLLTCAGLDSKLYLSRSGTFETIDVGISVDEAQGVKTIGCPNTNGATYRIVDLNGDSRADILVLKTNKEQIRLLSRWNSSPLLSGLVNTAGGITRPQYASLRAVSEVSAAPRYCDSDNAGKWRDRCGISIDTNRFVVTSISAWDGRGDNLDTPDESTEFQYADERAHPAPLPDAIWAGFGRTVERDLQSKTVTERIFYQDPVFAGRPKIVRGLAEGQDLLTEENFTYTDLIADAAVSQIVVSMDETFAFVNNAPYAKTSKTYVFDTYGYEKTIIDCSGLVTDPVRECILTENNYQHETNRAGTWRLGRLTSSKQSISTSADQASVGIVISWNKFEYFTAGAFNGLLQNRAELNCNDADQCREQADFKFVSVFDVQSYDLSGNVTAVSNVNGFVTHTTYDSQFPFNVHTEKAPSGEETVYSYDALGRLAQITDTNNAKVTYLYDAFGRKSRVENADGGWIATTVVNEGSPESQYTEERYATQAASVCWRRDFQDGFGFIYQTRSCSDSDRDIVTLRTRGYVSGRLIERTSEPHFEGGNSFRWLERIYDTRGRRVSERWVTIAADGSVSPDESIVSISYESWNLARIDDGLTNIAVEERDWRGNLLNRSFTERGPQHALVGSNTAHVYDFTGRIRSITESDSDNVSRQTRFRYDTQGRKLSSEDSVSGLWTFDYRADGQVRTLTDAIGRTTTFEYDRYGRFYKKTYSDGIPPVEYKYGDGSSGTNAKGRIREIDDGLQTQLFDYDSVGRISLITNQLRDFRGVTFREGIAYDFVGHVVSRRLPDGTTSGYTYSPAGNLLEIQVNGGNIVKLLGYNAQGEPAERVTQGNWFEPTTALTTTYTYQRNRLLHASTKRVDGTVLQDVDYVVDVRGDVSSILDKRTDKTVNGINTDQTQTFKYDGWGRLRRAESSGVYGVRTFTYNEFGDLEAFGGLKTRDFEYHDDGGIKTITDQQSSLEARFDKNGDIQSKKDGAVHWTYKFGSEHRLLAVNKDGVDVMEIAYDHVGLRKKTKSTIQGAHHTTHYVTPEYEVRTSDSEPGLYKITRTIRDDRGRPISSITNLGTWPTDATGARGLKTQAVDLFPRQLPAAKGEAGDLPVSLTAGPQLGTWFFHLNHIGSVAFVTDRDGVVVHRLTYLPFGELLQANSTGQIVSDIAFTGQQLDDQTGLIYLNSRYYDPSLGRFISPDTVIPAAALEADALNRYAYASNNPIIYSDPSGHWNFVKAVGGLVKTAFSTAGNSFKNTFNASEKFFRTLTSKPLKAIVNLPGDLFHAQERAARQALLENSDLRTIAMVAASVYGGPWGAAAFTAYMTYSATGSIEASLKAGAIAYISAKAFAEVDSVKVSGAMDHTGKALAMGTIGGVSAGLQGGDAEKGFTMAFGAAAVTAALESSNSAGNRPNYDRGTQLREKGEGFTPADLRSGDKNLGIARLDLSVAPKTFEEGSRTMLAVNEIRGMNSMSYFHDYFVGSLPTSLQNMKVVGFLLNQGTIPAAIGVNYYALGLSRDRYLLERAMETRH